MTEPAPTPTRSAESLNDDEALELMYLRGNPNPSRAGCPTGEVLEALARRQRPAEDPDYDHLTRCSPCFAQVRALQKSRVTRHLLRPSWTVAGWASAAALILGVGVGVGLWRLLPSTDADPNRLSVVALTVDLSQNDVSRSADVGPSTPFALPRAPLNLTIVLPSAYEPGEYEVQLLAADAIVYARARGVATLNDFITTLLVALDTTSVSAGRHQLAIRPLRGDWLKVPVTVE